MIGWILFNAPSRTFHSYGDVTTALIAFLRVKDLTLKDRYRHIIDDYFDDVGKLKMSVGKLSGASGSSEEPVILSTIIIVRVYHIPPSNTETEGGMV